MLLKLKRHIAKRTQYHPDKILETNRQKKIQISAEAYEV
jgi:DnaJ-class molecular chaperone